MKELQSQIEMLAKEISELKNEIRSMSLANQVQSNEMPNDGKQAANQERK